MNKKLLKIAFIKTLPVMAGYIILGAGFGILLKSNNFGLIWAIAMSTFIYAGSMQYVGISLITSGTPFLSIALTTLMVNARHLFYGISMIDKYKGAGFKKLYLMYSLTDETYSLVCTDDLPNDINPHTYYFLISLFDQIYWIFGSALGSLIGSIITFDIAGIEFSMTALFVTVFVEQWLSSKEHRPALIGLGSSVLCLFIFGSSKFLIPSMVLIILLLTVLRKSLLKGEVTDE